MIFSCCNENRKAAVLGNAAVNGIDYLEVLDSEAPAGVPRQQTLLVHCLNPLAAPPPVAANVLIAGGERIKPIGIDWVLPASAIDGTQPADIQLLIPVVNALDDKSNVLVVRTHEAGDFSTYRLRLVDDAAHAASDPFALTDVLAGFDRQLAEVDFSFKVECGPDFDCKPQLPDCAPPPLPAPPINYLAKDYGSFRTVILDRLHQLLPGWGGATEADLGVTLAELMAYVGDHLSYQQDAVATEAYLETARRRVSLRRHALLVDYRASDGCNARAFVALQVAGTTGTAVFLDRTQTRFYTFAPGMPASLAVGADTEEAAARAGVRVFEPMHDAVLYPEHNQFFFYTWGDTDCCLPRGATEATLLGPYPTLKPGMVLIFQEVVGPQTGNPADADIRNRCAVRLTDVTTTDDHGKLLEDPLFKDAHGVSIKVTEIKWAQADALPFPVCISSTYLDSVGDKQSVNNVSVVFGNVVLADHGLRFPDRPLPPVPPPRLYYPRGLSADRCKPTPPAPLPVRYRPLLPDRPLTEAVPLATGPLPGAGNPAPIAVVPLGATGFVVLTDGNGFATLTLVATNPAGWPHCFGVVTSANAANPPNFDLTVVYNPPAGAPGIQAQVPLEKFTDLSLTPADPNYAATQINANSRLIRVPATFVPPGAPPSAFPAAPAMLTNTGAVDLQDPTNPATTYLTVQAANPSVWPQFFGIEAHANAQDPARFDLSVVYDPPSSVGVVVPVTVELFADLSLADAASHIDDASQLIAVKSFAQAPDPNLSAHDLMTFDPGKAVPVISLTGVLDQTTTSWLPERDLLENGESDPVFVVEVEADGTAMLRFGDDTNGKRPDTGTSFTASYRIGNGREGNVGADTLIHLSVADARIQACRNPLPATGGMDAETPEQIRRRAPQAFLTQERAVTMADYDAMAELNPQVERAAANLRWTGSWYTVFVAIEPKGGGNTDRPLAKAIKRGLERYRLAGQDLEIDSPQYVSLEIGLTICVDPDYFQSDVQRALLEILSNKCLPSGERGIFYPDNFTFGQTVYLSPIYAAARSVAGVVSVTATTFQPQGVNTNQFLISGEMKLGPLQVARLDNDRNYPDHGQLTLVMEGGR